MKAILFTILVSLISLSAFAQNLPSIQLKDIDGKAINIKYLVEKENSPVVLIFWATWSPASKKFLIEVDDIYPKWQNTEDAKVTIVSLDDQKAEPSVRSYIERKGWDFQALLDPKTEFKRAMNVNDVPHVFVLNGKGQVIWQTSKITGSTISEITAKLKD